MELSDGETEGIDGLELGKGLRSETHLCRIEVVSHRQYPVLFTRLAGVTWGVYLRDVHECRTACHSCVLHGLLRHGRDGYAVDLDIALLDLIGEDLRDQVRRIVLSHVL